MLSKICASLLLAGTALGSPIEPRQTSCPAASDIPIADHGAIVGFPQEVPDNSTGAAYTRFQPYLYVANGCVPFPAVDENGTVSAGLKPSGSSDGDCSQSTGQVYVRGGYYGSNYGIMYAWFMPKDEPSDGIGHRYDWECAVVWIDDPAAAAPVVVGLSASAHGNFNTKKSGFADNFDGTRALIEYVSYWPLDHQMAITTTVGGSQPAIAWESMTDAARCSLTNFDFGSANVPFIESSFVGNLEEAWNAGDDNI